MRSIWNGSISFGLVSIPIKLVNATENHSISFRQVHAPDGSRIRYRKVCELDEREVTAAEIGKGYEDADGTIIPITDEDLASLPLPTAKTIQIVSFLPDAEVDPLQMDTAYYLAANGAPAAKPYTLLREALRRSKKVAIAKFALRGRERLGMLRVIDDVITMHGLLWPDEIREPEGVAPEANVSVRDAELDLAEALMDTLGEVDVDSLTDDYRAALEELIAAKASGELPVPRPEEGEGKVIDLMAALEKSVRAAQGARDAGEGRSAEVTPIRKPAKKSAAAVPKSVGGKKSTAKKAAAKKTAAHKTTAKKSAAKSTGATKSTAAKRTATKTTAKKTTAKKTATKPTTAKKRSSG
ncbi:Ku protein [Streptomyces sp. NPDC051219]|uniref:non-homologous end joining protein Ku n=1 Tax=Streptomyces sp. NPDC051219 TaxID=3155283 RepID=UPI003427C9FB